MKKSSYLTVVLFGACAVIWTIRGIYEIIYQTYNDSIFWFVINILCAIVWITVFVVHWKGYRSSKKN